MKDPLTNMIIESGRLGEQPKAAQVLYGVQDIGARSRALKGRNEDTRSRVKTPCCEHVQLEPDVSDRIQREKYYVVTPDRCIDVRISLMMLAIS